METKNCKHILLEISGSITKEDGLGVIYGRCSCGHEHPTLEIQTGWNNNDLLIDHSLGFCEHCRKFKKIIEHKGKLVLETSNCELCKLLACLH